MTSLVLRAPRLSTTLNTISINQVTANKVEDSNLSCSGHLPKISEILLCRMLQAKKGSVHQLHESLAPDIVNTRKACHK